MKKMMIAAAGAGMLLVVGCESAVLVNNRPEREPNWEANPTAQQPQQASATIDPSEARPAGATTQPADQSVQTQDVRIESQSN